MAETKLTKKDFVEASEQLGVYENQFTYTPSKKKGPNLLGSEGPIFKLTFSESSHQIRQLGYNRIFGYFCLGKNGLRPQVPSLGATCVFNQLEIGGLTCLSRV